MTKNGKHNKLLKAIANTKPFRAIARHGDDIESLESRVRDLQRKRGGVRTQTAADVQRAIRYLGSGNGAEGVSILVDLIEMGFIENKGFNKVAGQVEREVTEEIQFVMNMLESGFWVYAEREPLGPFGSEVLHSFAYWTRRLPELGYSVPEHMEEEGIILAIHSRGVSAKDFLERWAGTYPEAIDAVLQHTVDMSALMVAETKQTAQLEYQLAKKWEQTIRSTGVHVTKALEEAFEAVRAYEQSRKVVCWTDRAAVNVQTVVEHLEEDPQSIIEIGVADPERFSREFTDQIDFEHPAYLTVPGHVLEGMWSRAPVEYDDFRRDKYTEICLDKIAQAGFDLRRHDIPLEQVLVAMRLSQSAAEYTLTGPRATRMLANYLGVEEVTWMSTGADVDYVSTAAHLLAKHADRFVEKVQSALRVSA